jgi:putative endonuclease
MWYVYLARCRDASLYTGIAKDPAKRLQQHNAGAGSKYVRSRLPASLLHAWTCGSKSEAQRLECLIKALSRRQKLS